MMEKRVKTACNIRNGYTADFNAFIDVVVIVVGNGNVEVSGLKNDEG
jgi:hypothetical protein